MIDIPPPMIPDPPQPRAAPPWRGRLAWTAILLIAGYLFVGNFLPQLRGRAPRDAGSDMQLELAAKYALGLRQLLPSTPTPQLMKAIDKEAHTDVQKLHAAIVSAELEGRDPAIQRLDELTGPEVGDDVRAIRSIYTSAPLDAAQQKRLIEQHGFFGKLALSHGLDDSAPLRAEVSAKSRRTALALFIGFGIILLAALSGLVLLTIGIVLKCTGTLRPRYVRDRGTGTVYVETFAVYLLSFVVLMAGLGLVLGGRGSIGWSWLLTIVVPIAMGYALLRGQSWEQVRRALGLHGGLLEIPMGIVGYLAGLPVLAVGFVITLLLIRLSGATPSHPIQDAPLDSVWQVLLLYSIAAVWAPVVEELMFRGALFHHLRRRWNWLISASVVALIFAAIHPQGWATIPVLGSIAIVLAGIREWRGSIIAPMVAHGLNNAAVVTLLVLVK